MDTIKAAIAAIAGCNFRNEHAIVLNPIDMQSFEGFWIDAKGAVAYVLSVNVEGRPRSRSRPAGRSGI